MIGHLKIMLSTDEMILSVYLCKSGKLTDIYCEDYAGNKDAVMWTNIDNRRFEWVFDVTGVHTPCPVWRPTHDVMTMSPASPRPRDVPSPPDDIAQRDSGAEFSSSQH